MVKRKKVTKVEKFNRYSFLKSLSDWTIGLIILFPILSILLRSLSFNLRFAPVINTMTILIGLITVLGLASGVLEIIKRTYVFRNLALGLLGMVFLTYFIGNYLDGNGIVVLPFIFSMTALVLSIMSVIKETREKKSSLEILKSSLIVAVSFIISGLNWILIEFAFTDWNIVGLSG